MTVSIDMKLLLVVILAVTFCSAQSQRPGTKIRINQRGLDLAGDVVLKTFENKLRRDGIPNASGSSGRVSWSMWSIRIGTLTSPRSTITVSGAGVRQVLTLQRFSVSLSWRAKYKRGWFRISTSGRISATASGIRIDHTVSLGKTSSGQPTMRSVRCSGSIGGLSLRFSGGISWIINIFRGAISRKVKSALERRICPVVTDAINTKGNAALRATNMVIPVVPNIAIDYRLVSNPAFANGHMDVNAKGRALLNGRPTSSSSPAPLTLGSSASKMLYVEISDYTLNTLSEALYRNNRLQATVSKSLALAGTAVRVVATVRAAAAPVVDITPARLRLFIQARTSVRATVGTNTQTFTILTNATVAVTTRITGNRLTFTVTTLTATNQVVGSGSSLPINDLVNGILPNVKTIMNQEGAKGVKLPVVKYASYVNPSLQLRQRSILVSTDIRPDILQPPPLPTRPTRPIPIPTRCTRRPCSAIP